LHEDRGFTKENQCFLAKLSDLRNQLFDDALSKDLCVSRNRKMQYKAPMQRVSQTGMQQRFQL